MSPAGGFALSFGSLFRAVPYRAYGCLPRRPRCWAVYGRHPDEVVLGAIVARTGDRALWGEDLYRGIELAVEQLNLRGGLLGRHVRLIALDDSSFATNKRRRS